MAAKRKKAKPERPARVRELAVKVDLDEHRRIFQAGPKPKEEKRMPKHHDDETEAVEVSGAKTAAPQEVSPEEIDRAVEFMSRQFSGAIPEAALRENPYELPEDDVLRRMKNPAIPDGRYRVTGHEYILNFEGGQLIEVEHVTAATDHDSYAPIPHPPQAT